MGNFRKMLVDYVHNSNNVKAILFCTFYQLSKNKSVMNNTDLGTYVGYFKLAYIKTDKVNNDRIV